jgi:V-type H+-transporting ATPase subunit E
MGLTDAEVGKELNKMIQFIKQEANEKAREIQVKADEEHNIEKAKLLRQETLAIEELYQKKVKQSEVQKRIAQSNDINSSRLKVLKCKEELLTLLFEEARGKLVEISSKSGYPQLLRNLILQGLFQVFEKEVSVICRQKDVEIVKSFLKDVVRDYEDRSKESKTKVTIDTVNFLPESCSGGVILTGLGGRIQCNNTLEARMELARDALLPTVRLMLFGPSASRKFFE